MTPAAPAPRQRLAFLRTRGRAERRRRIPEAFRWPNRFPVQNENLTQEQEKSLKEAVDFRDQNEEGLRQRQGRYGLSNAY